MSQKRPVESPEPLEQEQRRLNDEIRVTKRRAKGHGSFNAQFWANSQELEILRLQRTETDRKISLRNFPGTPSEWEQTEKAKDIFQMIKAQQTTIKLYQRRADELDATKGDKKNKRSFRDAFMKLFTTSKMGIGISQTGTGTRDSRQQSAFREELISLGDAKHPKYDWLWCPIISDWCEATTVQAAHLFPHMHGQEVMDSIFGKKTPPELFSARNGMLVPMAVERFFDSGKFVICPDLPDRPALAELLAWIRQDSREYRLKILDLTWDKLDHPLSPNTTETWRSRDGKKLEFRTSFRPAARYLYFHYCIQILRRAWGHNSSRGSVSVLEDEAGRPFWGTPGRYMPKNMLLALVEEVGHEYKGLLDGAGSNKSEPTLLLEVASAQIKTRPALKDVDWHPEDETDEDEDDEEDSY
ncbi:hypothetical protein BDW59DRAFT_181768 [Aspergillus cavernicola]|uniref:HNH nuclease domain-containing protein n=1 Tax=Aspergillus cavernicola TaxID=176166 RepID=A0ABR4HUP4_9EURO